MIQEWPRTQGKIDGAEIKDFELIQNIVTAIRNLRAESKLPPAKKLKAIIVSKKQARLIKDQAGVIENLARLEELKVLTAGKKPAKSLSAVVSDAEIYLPVSGMINIDKEHQRLTKELKRVEEFVQHLAVKLENKRFLERAPKDIIEKEKVKLIENQEKLKQIKSQLKTLK